MANQKDFLVCVAILLQLTNYGLSAGSQDIHKQADDLSVYSSATQVILGRQKRQSFVSCPNRPASGSETGRSYVLYYSASSRQDVTIGYGGSRKGWSDSELKKLANNGFNSSQPSLIYLHAYTQSAQSGWLQKMRQLYNEFSAQTADKQTTFNLLFFDWSAYSRQAYGTSVSWVPHLGKVLGDFLNRLADRYSYNLNEVHLVSYSLSTHIAGNAGRRTRGKVGQITALDPTGVCLHHDNAFARKYSLKAGDAKLVVARHYDMDGLGAKRAIGGVDIYVNGGRNQPGSAYNGRRKRASGDVDDKPTGENSMIVRQYGSSSVGSHARAAEHESQAEDGNCYEVAYACRNYAAFLAGECASCGKQNNRCYYLNNIGTFNLEQNVTSKVRSGVNYKPKTRMYIKTGPSKYCLHHYQFVVKLKASSTPNVKKSLKSGQVSFELEPNGQQVAPKHKAKGNSYTALITSNKRLKESASIGLVLGGSSKVNQDEFVSSVDQVELNYMSHAISSERERLSSRYCWDSATNAFVKCQPDS